MSADYSTVTFLGATVVSFNCGLGWNDEVSTLNVTLVEDDVAGDAFNPPEVGYPATFNFSGWTFAGILEKWTRSASMSGNLINVTLVDPRNLLDGVAVILDGYSSTVSVPNVINAYGYLENLYGFGGSQKNEDGIPYLLLGQAILACANSVNGTGYGGPIRYKGVSYGLDISNLPALSAVFRIGGVTKLSLMEILRDICEAGACEMFFRLEGTTTPIIKLYTISRGRIPNIGVINQFLSSVEGAVSKDVGLEMVNDTSAKFLVGGKREDIFYQTLSGGNDGDILTGTDNTIWPYWGQSFDGRLICGDGIDIQHTFPLDVRGLQIPGLGDTYYTDVGEIAAALSGYDTWCSYLWLNWSNRYRPDPNAGNVDAFFQISSIFNGNITIPTYVQGSTPYFHNDVLNPHFLKAVELNLPSAINPNILSILFGANNNNVLFKIKPDALMANFVTGNSIFTQTLYQFLKNIGEEYYGKKFMVRVPQVLTKYNTDTMKLDFSVLPKNSGWLESDVIANAQSAGMLPGSFYWATDDSNKIIAFARFASPDYIDLSRIPPEDICLSADGNWTFVRCQVNPEFVFLDTTNYTDARAIITLPGVVQERQDARNSSDVLRYWLLMAINMGLFGNDKLQPIIDKLGPALKYLSFDYTLPYLPNMVGIPLESQVSTYGPWYFTTSIGKTEMEQDTGLVPWEYGSTTVMNQAGYIKVQEINSLLQTLEYGSVEFPGIPSVPLGNQLLNTGPYVTDISVDTSTNGVTTRYSMRSWTPKFGKLAKYTSDRFFKMKKQMMGIEREIGMMQEEMRKIKRDIT